jgi:hypothetical protein
MKGKNCTNLTNLPVLTLRCLQTVGLGFIAGFCLLCISPAVHSLQAQALFVGEGQVLSLGENSLISMRGNLENQGELINDGEISLQGNWTNQGTYEAGSGLVRLAGSTDQLLDHGGQAMYSLTVESGGSILLQSDLEVLHDLELLAGVIRAGTDDNILRFSRNAEIFGGSPQSYVDGTLVHEGTGYKFFPLGTANTYLPLELLDIRGVNSVIGARVIEPHPEPNSLINLETVSRQRYWLINRLDGTYEGSLIRLQVRNEPGFSDLTGLVVAASPELNGTYISLGQSAIEGTVNEGSITSEEPTSLPIITLGQSDQFSVEGEVLVPNAFAPTSSIEEDRSLNIYAVNLLEDQFVFRIFNRWGQIVYETQSLDEALTNGWNGINQETNEPAQFGVYSYYLSGRFSNNAAVVKKGTLTLFR